HFESSAIVNNQIIKQSGPQRSKNRQGLVLTASDCGNVLELFQVLPCETDYAVLNIAGNPSSLDVEITSRNIAHCTAGSQTVDRGNVEKSCFQDRSGIFDFADARHKNRSVTCDFQSSVNA